MIRRVRFFGLAIAVSSRQAEAMGAKLRSEWSREDILEEARNWCARNHCAWKSALEQRKKEDLIKLFLTSTGNYGGVREGHFLLYVNQAPLMKFDEKKCERFFKPPEEIERLERTVSRGHAWTTKGKAPENKRSSDLRRKKNSLANEVGQANSAGRKDKSPKKKNSLERDPLMGTGHASYGGSKKKPAYPKYEGPYDPDRAAELLAKKFGNKVKRLN